MLDFDQLSLSVLIWGAIVVLVGCAMCLVGVSWSWYMEHGIFYPKCAFCRRRRIWQENWITGGYTYISRQSSSPEQYAFICDSHICQHKRLFQQHDPSLIKVSFEELE